MGQRVKQVNGSTGHFHFHYIIYDSRQRQAHTTPLQKAHGVNGLTGQWVNGSNGSTDQWVTFTFTILYMVADDARLTPPCCKKHTAYDDTRLTPHCCKKHTASFARSTGKFPSLSKCNLWCWCFSFPYTLVCEIFSMRSHRKRQVLLEGRQICLFIIFFYH